MTTKTAMNKGRRRRMMTQEQRRELADYLRVNWPYIEKHKIARSDAAVDASQRLGFHVPVEAVNSWANGNAVPWKKWMTRGTKERRGIEKGQQVEEVPGPLGETAVETLARVHVGVMQAAVDRHRLGELIVHLYGRLGEELPDDHAKYCEIRKEAADTAVQDLERRLKEDAQKR